MNDWRSDYLHMTQEGPRTIWSTLLYWGLCPLSFVYGLVMRVRSSLYRAGLISSYRASVPVISVGNLVIGGTGKTPMVDFLVRSSPTHPGDRGDYRFHVDSWGKLVEHLLDGLFDLLTGLLSIRIGWERTVRNTSP